MSEQGPRLLVNAAGRLVPRDQPWLRADDPGVLRGDGLFESLLVADGEPQLLTEHLARMERSATIMDLPLPPAGQWRRQWQRCIHAAVQAWTGGPEMAVRLIVTRGTHATGLTSYLLAEPVSPTALAQRRDGISALTLERGLDPGLADHAPWLLMGDKVLSYAVNMAAQRWAQAHHADDAIFVTDGDLVLDASTSAVVIARGRQLLSPPVSLGILPSITVGRLFAAAADAGWATGYDRLTVDDLHQADGVWLLSSVRLAARVHTLDGVPLPDTGLHAQISGITGPARLTRAGPRRSCA